jgi:RNA polymerase sigma factor (sigma-70 family)
MKDYRVTVRINNNYLLTLIEDKGYASLAEVARQANVSYGELQKIASLKSPLKNKQGEWRPIALQLADFLSVMPENLSPPQHIDDPLKKTRASFEADLEELPLLEPSSQKTLEDKTSKEDVKKAIKECLLTLPPKEERVLRMLFGIDCEPHTHQQIGDMLGVSHTRASQICKMAIRKLRHPTQSRKLLTALVGEFSNDARQNLQKIDIFERRSRGFFPGPRRKGSLPLDLGED